MNTYKVPRENRTQQEYFDYVGTLPVMWVGAAAFSIDPNDQLVTVDGMIEGFDLVASFTPPPPPAPVRMLDKADFIARFRPAEYAGIKALRLTDPTVDWLMAVLDAARDEINLNSARLAGGLGYIESLPNSPLASGRAAQILGA